MLVLAPDADIGLDQSQLSVFAMFLSATQLSEVTADQTAAVGNSLRK